MKILRIDTLNHMRPIAYLKRYSWNDLPSPSADGWHNAVGTPFDNGINVCGVQSVDLLLRWWPLKELHDLHTDPCVLSLYEAEPYFVGYHQVTFNKASAQLLAQSRLNHHITEKSLHKFFEEGVASWIDPLNTPATHPKGDCNATALEMSTRTSWKGSKNTEKSHWLNVAELSRLLSGELLIPEQVRSRMDSLLTKGQKSTCTL